MAATDSIHPWGHVSAKLSKPKNLVAHDKLYVPTYVLTYWMPNIYLIWFFNWLIVTTSGSWFMWWLVASNYCFISIKSPENNTLNLWSYERLPQFLLATQHNTFDTFEHKHSVAINMTKQTGFDFHTYHHNKSGCKYWNFGDTWPRSGRFQNADCEQWQKVKIRTFITEFHSS